MITVTVTKSTLEAMSFFFNSYSCSAILLPDFSCVFWKVSQVQYYWIKPIISHALRPSICFGLSSVKRITFCPIISANWRSLSYTLLRTFSRRKPLCVINSVTPKQKADGFAWTCRKELSPWLPAMLFFDVWCELLCRLCSTLYLFWPPTSTSET